MIEIKRSELTKLYYSIGEVSKMFDVNTSLIRFWEKEFASIKPKKNKKGNRLFSPESILEIQKIYHLVKIEGHTLEGAKKALKTYDERLNERTDEIKDKEEIIQRLYAIRKKLIALK
ncbi:transcriptional regulator [Brumimicrobium salinarum]|uniref:Transcriptional regulator n=1 Tax=Brumimicrobium salinarum TaxID=2058658 RepID=A0A2I0QZJ4_9FLAO|nr:MerR family transcriptional regulator [Brumimicrobium salinarum]PKR79751.1 transcriptional regulator [Brumimicrobium salinarum]